MKLIENLGIKNFGTYKAKVGIYECTICKKHYEVKTTNVTKRGVSKCKSCAAVIRNTKHGRSDTTLYSIWNSIRYRCSAKHGNVFNVYGYKGITMCKQWKDDFKSFYDWSMLNGYKKGLSIDRINNDGNYEPSNCRWTDRETQMRNTRLLIKTNKTGYRGVSVDGETKKFKSQIRANGKKIGLGYFNTAEEAGYAYDKYVVENNLEHTTNGLYKKEME